MTVRRATPADLPDLLWLLRTFRQESSYYTPPLSGPKVQVALQALIDGQEGGDTLLLVSEDAGRITGGVAAERTEDLWTDSKVVVEYFLYVLPEKRGSFDAGKLILLFKSWAESEPASIRAQATSGIDNEDAFAMYERLGWPVRGRVYGTEVF